MESWFFCQRSKNVLEKMESRTHLQGGAPRSEL